MRSSEGVELNPNAVSFSDQQGSAMLDRLRYQRSNGHFCDVVLVVKNRRFAAHRNVLAACSPYFASILKNSRVVKEQVVVNCQNSSAFALLLEYMYSGNVVIDRNSVTDLLKLASNLLITKVKNYCAEYLDKNMEVSDVLTVKELAQKYNLPGLLRSACDFIKQNINNCLIQSDDILEYSLNQLNSFLTEPTYRNLISPSAHLSLVVRWIGHNASQRASLFREMLDCCLIKQVERVSLEDLLDCSPFLNHSLSCRLTLLQYLCENSIPLGKYEADFHSLLNQFPDERVSVFPDEQAPGTMSQEKGKSENKNQYARESIECVPLKNSQEGIKYGSAESQLKFQEENGQPPVFGEPTTNDILESCNLPEASRPPLKVKIQLNMLKNQVHDTGVDQRKPRKSLSTASNTLAKRRGRPPKYLNRDIGLQYNSNQEQDLEEFIDCAPSIIEKVIYDEEDEFDPFIAEEQIEQDVAEERNLDLGENLEKCDYCDFNSASHVQKRRHIAQEHAKNIVYVCSVCGFECRWNREFYEHSKTHFSGPPFHCDLCDFMDNQITVFLSHRVLHSNDRPYKCNICGTLSRSKSSLIIHCRVHHTDKPLLVCQFCNRSFTLKSSFDQHVANHSQSRPFRCSQCNFSTKYQSHLISHKRIHTGDVFHCFHEGCSYWSPKKSQLAAHLRTHLAYRAFSCNICNRSFIEKSHLVRHERIHLEDKPFKCDNCDYSSSRRDKLKEHIQKHHNTSATNKQHRRRYRRAKQLAQLAAQSKTVQPTCENTFRPIQPDELMDCAENSPSLQTFMPMQSAANLVLSHQVDNGMHAAPNQNDIASTSILPQQHMQFGVTAMKISDGATNRPSSAKLPSPAMRFFDPSPTMSLMNFRFGQDFESPLPTDSLKTPVLSSPSTMNIHNDASCQNLLGPQSVGVETNETDIGENGYRNPRPMSLPPPGTFSFQPNTSFCFIRENGERLMGYSGNNQDLQLFDTENLNNGVNINV